MITQRLVLRDGLWTCAHCRAGLTEGVLVHHDLCTEMPPGRERQHVDRLKASVRVMQESLERKNRELDALHLVWCDGGCPSGVHRWNDALITRELVETAERNTRRLRRWYRIAEFRMKLPGADEWQRKRALRLAAKTDLPAGGTPCS